MITSMHISFDRSCEKVFAHIRSLHNANSNLVIVLAVVGADQTRRHSGMHYALRSLHSWSADRWSLIANRSMMKITLRRDGRKSFVHGAGDEKIFTGLKIGACYCERCYAVRCLCVRVLGRHFFRGKLSKHAYLLRSHAKSVEKEIEKPKFPDCLFHPPSFLKMSARTYLFFF